MSHTTQQKKREKEMRSNNPSDSTSPPHDDHHVVLFPFMSKGHTIPVLRLARLFLKRRRISVTIVTTPANRPFIAHSLADTAASIVDIHFPDNVPDIPAGIESTDKLPSISLFHSFVDCTKRMQADFERSLRSLPKVSFLVSDGFLWWTLESATKFGVPRLVYFGMSAYTTSVCRSVMERGLIHEAESDNELITVADFPWIKVTRNDFDPTVIHPEVHSFNFEVHMNVVTTMADSIGLILNDFYELVPVFVDSMNPNGLTRNWCVGPLCLAEPTTKVQPQPSNTKPAWIQWLDQMLALGISVLYVAFGSQAEVSPEQLKEIAIGLEESNVNFLWVIRRKESELLDGYEERVKGRGMMVRDWVDQREILMHESVQGFVSHCGWNSVLESICAEVPILTWPMMADQPLNARMVVEEIKVGLRVETCDGSVKGFVEWEGLKKMVKELMEGDEGKEVRKKVKQVAEMAKKAMEEGGSSWCNLDTLIDKYANKEAYD